MRNALRRSTVLTLVVTLPLLALAQKPDAPEPPKSPKAKAALAKYDRAVAKAKADYDRAVATAARELRGDLDDALKAAMKAGSLDEAKRIEAALVRVKGDAVEVRADQDWQSAGVTLRKGETLKLAARGSWRAGPGLPRAVGPEGARYEGREMFFLEARVGDGPAVRVNAGARIEADRDGELQLRMHDTNWGDNSGAVTVTISRS